MDRSLKPTLGYLSDLGKCLGHLHSPRSADFRWPRSRRRQTPPPHSRSSNRLKQETARPSQFPQGDPSFPAGSGIRTSASPPRAGAISVPDLVRICHATQDAVNRQAEAMCGGQSLRPGPETSSARTSRPCWNLFECELPARQEPVQAQAEC
jgi:hypothetical protein